MVVRITRTNCEARTVLRVDGLLQAADVEALNREWETAGGTVTLELSQLQSADARGVEAIHELVSHGAALQGLSPYIELLLSTCGQRRSGDAAARGMFVEAQNGNWGWEQGTDAGEQELGTEPELSSGRGF